MKSHAPRVENRRPAPHKTAMTEAKASQHDGPTPRALFVAFLVMGLSGFGGVLPWARRVLVERTGWLTAESFNDTLAFCQSLPGPNIVNMSVVVGDRFAGPAGAAAAFTGLVAAPVAIVLVLAVIYQRYGSLGQAPHAIAAIGAAAAGLVAATAVKMAWPLARRQPLFAGALIALAFAGAGLARWPLAGVVLALAPVGWAIAWMRRT
jgi:chromate transporter